MPNKINNIAEINDKTWIYLLSFNRYLLAELNKIATTIKGIANPNENTAKSCAPANHVDEALASVRTAPKIGPTHGVHPAPKAAPNTKALNDGSILPVFLILKRLKTGNLIKPSMPIPAKTRKTPANLVIHKRKPTITVPRSPKPAPKKAP